MRRILTTLFCIGCISFLCGCRTLRGPVWSPDGRFLAYTAYRVDPENPTEGLTTEVCVIDADAQELQPTVIAPGSACPAWDEDARTLYFMGGRDKSGFYSGIYSCRPFSGNESIPRELLKASKLTDFQMSSNGKLALLCSGDTNEPAALCTVQLWQPKENKTTPLNLGKINSPALSPDGKMLAFSGNVGATANWTVFILELNGTQPIAAYPPAGDAGADPGPYTVTFLPDNDRIMFWSQEGGAIWTVRRTGQGLRRRQLPPQYGAPVLVSFTDDCNNAFVTLPRPAAQGLRFAVFNADLVRDSTDGVRGWKQLPAGSGGWHERDGEADAPFGGHAVAPGRRRGVGGMRAWLSPAGVALDVGGRTRFCPLTEMEALIAAEAYLKAGRAQDALAALARARNLLQLSRRVPAKAAAKKFDALAADLALVEAQIEHLEAAALAAAGDKPKAASVAVRATLLYPIGAEGLAFHFGESLGLPRPSSEVATVRQRLFAEVLAGTPHERLAIWLKSAFEFRAKNQPEDSLGSLRSAEPDAPEELLTAGLKFWQGVAYFETGRPGEAALQWEAAARVNGWPQAVYAAGLAAVGYSLEGSQRGREKAKAILEFGASLPHPAAVDMAFLEQECKTAVWKRGNIAGETKSPDGLRIFVEREEYSIPRVALRPFTPRFVPPTHALEKDAKTVATTGPRLLALEKIFVSRVRVGEAGKPARLLTSTPAAISIPQISPDGRFAAFSAGGEVFPLQAQPCRLFAVDMNGRLLIGDEKSYHQGAFQGREIIRDFRWLNSTEVEVSGTETDVFGREKPFSRKEIARKPE